MTTAYTSLLGLALPVTGELSGTWGDTVNNSITSLLDSAIAGTQTLTADTTLTTTTGAANQSRQAILLCSPASANITITAPAQSKIYTVINTSAVYTVTVRGAGPTTGVTLAVSESAVVAWNGTDFIRISSNSATTGNFTVNGNLSVTGNTTLGDASTDTVTVNGYMGVGGAGATTTGLKVVSAALTGTAQDGIQSAPVATSAATSQVRAFTAIPGTAAAAFTCTTAYGFRAFDASTGAGSTITNLYGVYVNDLTQATNNYGIGSAVSSGTNKFNIYAIGTADNYFAGNVGIGSTSPVTKLEVAGNNNSTWSAASTTISGTTMTIAGTVTGTIAIGDLIYAAGIQVYTRITAGSGLSWTVSVSQTLASSTVLGGPIYGNTVIRITDTDTSQGINQPTGSLQFFTSDATAPTAGVGAYVAAVAEDSSPDTALIFGTRDDGGGGVDANERMRIDSAGNVGIGTGNPNANLEISNAGNATLRLTAGNTSSSIIQLGDTDDGNVGEITYSHSTNSMAFDTNDVERMRIDSSGNVLVGTTSNASTQGSPLQVIPAIAARRNIASAGGPAFRMEKSRATTDGTYTIVSNGDTLGDYQFFGADGAQYIIGASVKAEVDAAPSLNVMPTALVFSTENSAGTYAERMRLESSGNLGVGTSSPRVRFQVTPASNSESPALGTANDGSVFTSLSGAYGLNIGAAPSGYTWMQSMRFDGTATAYSLVLQAAGGSVGIGMTSPTAVLMLKAGTATASTSPLKFTSGTNLTSAEAGSIEYDGNVFYGTADVTSGRGLWPTTQYFRLTADGTAIGPTIANFFGATSGKSLDTSAFYEVEYNLYFTKTTAGTVTFTLTYANAPINCNADYVGTPVGGVGTVGSPQTAALVKSTGTASALPVTGSLTTGVNHQYVVKAIFQANATTGGTLNLQVTSSAGTVTPLTGSYYKATRLPAANTGAFA